MSGHGIVVVQTLAAGMLMLFAGLAKRRLELRPRRAPKRRRRL